MTRYEPSDGPQTQMVAFMRSMFRERVLTNTMLKSTAISDAGLSKQTLYEVGRENFTRATYDRALESLDAVNAEIEALMLQHGGGSREPERYPSRTFDRPRAQVARWQLARKTFGKCGRPEAVPKQLVRSGAVGAMGRSLGKLAHAAEEARALIAAGDNVVEIDPALIDSSFLTDRLTV